MIIYIALIQICLFIQTFIVIWCECTPLFANTVKSILFRALTALSLVIVGSSAHYLEKAPYPVLLAVFFIVVISTLLLIKYIIKEHNLRDERLNKILKHCEDKGTENKDEH